MKRIGKSDYYFFKKLSSFYDNVKLMIFRNSVTFEFPPTYKSKNDTKTQEPSFGKTFVEYIISIFFRY